MPESLRDILAIKLTEEMTLAAPETANRALARAARPVALEHAAAADAVVLGPGLSRDPEAFALAGDLVRELAMPAVVDADALNALAAGAGDGAGARAALTVAAAPRVLTPHLGEMSRLTGIPADQIERDRIDLARRFARERNCVVVLKGAPTVTAAPDGHATVNPTGNPGMATAGEERGAPRRVRARPRRGPLRAPHRPDRLFGRKPRARAARRARRARAAPRPGARARRRVRPERARPALEESAGREGRNRIRRQAAR